MKSKAQKQGFEFVEEIKDLGNKVRIYWFLIKNGKKWGGMIDAQNNEAAISAARNANEFQAHRTMLALSA
jgi:hypothetical protein